LEIQYEAAQVGSAVATVHSTYQHLDLAGGGAYDVTLMISYALNGRDLSGYSSLQLDGILQDPTAVTYTVVAVSDGKGASSSSVTTPGLFEGSISFPLHTFLTTSGDGVNWMHVDSLALSIDPSTIGGGPSDWQLLPSTGTQSVYPNDGALRHRSTHAPHLFRSVLSLRTVFGDFVEQTAGVPRYHEPQKWVTMSLAQTDESSSCSDVEPRARRRLAAGCDLTAG
jgi:hypothetical protein